MSRIGVVLGVAALGLLAALATAGVLYLIDSSSDDEPIELSDEGLGLFKAKQGPLRKAFNTDWDRYRNGTFWIESSVDRKRVSDDEVLTWTQIYAQLPPDRVVVGLGGTTGTFDGSPVSCAGEKFATPTGCVSGRSSADYEEMVENEAKARATYFERGSPAYLLRRDENGCYGLLLTRPVAAPPYGESSTFCFEEATGALVLSVVDRETTIETTTAIEVRTDVTRDEIAALVERDPG